MSSPLLELEGVRLSYDHGRVVPLEGVDQRVQAGARVCVRGKSGSGKTSLLLVAGGMLRPDAGRVQLAGERLYDLSAGARAHLRGRALGFVFQSFHLVPYLDVRANVARSLGPGAAGADDVEAALDAVGLSARARHRPSQLSAGERQRAALARALVGRPDVVLADEPTGNLDEDNAARVRDGLEAHRARGGAVVLVTHGDVPVSASQSWQLAGGRLNDAGAQA